MTHPVTVETRGDAVPESKGRKQPAYVPPPSKKDPVKIGTAPWVAPVMVACFLIGLIWIVAFYIAGPDIPVMKDLGNLVNVLIGFAFIGVGFALATRWR